MANIERAASFYLGKEYDLRRKDVLADKPVMYDARDLTTHAVCIGMTGSGKTGLAVTLLEEAALDGIPSIVIDPKGDMTNLLLTFPDLRPSDFQPWINPDDARRKDQSIAEYAATTAETWRSGLAEWDQGGERIRRLRDAAEFAIYTPGSDAGLQVSVLRSFQAPDLSWDDEEENLRELIAGTVSGLLGLIGIQADPVQSREHILLSHILEEAWRRGRSLDLAQLIQAIQRPPLKKLGVFDVDTFYPEKDRFELAMALNRVVASPSFENWIEGAPLDIARLIHTPEGKPRVSIFYVAHLDDAERMFFVTLLLERLLSWTRRLSGTTSLRCLLYFDELFGYFPPHPANPPSKRPLLALLKTARAFGVGLALTTQNPVDLDYKGLTNAGTWFIGKLQTDRDKARVLEGMEGVVSESNTMLDRSYLDRLISSLDSRVFVLHNVHNERPLLYKTRWALSYLRGPLTRSQVRQLMSPLKPEEPSQVASFPSRPLEKEGSMVVEPSRPAPAMAAEEEGLPGGYTPVRPQVQGRVAQYFLPVQVAEQQAARALADRLRRRLRVNDTQLVYEPYLVAQASVLYSDAGRTQVKEVEVSCLLPLPDVHGVVDWGRHIAPEFQAQDLAQTTYSEAAFNTLPDGMTQSPPYTQLRNAFLDAIYREQSLPAWRHPQLKLTSSIGETEDTFQARCEAEADRQREQELDKVRQRFARQLEQLQGRLDREERELTDDRIDYKGRKQEELLSAGESVLSLFLRRGSTRSLSMASRRRRMTEKAKADVEESETLIERLKKDIEDLLRDQDAALEKVRSAWADIAGGIQESVLRPRKTDIRAAVFGLAWVPHWHLAYEDEQGAGQVDLVPAYPLP